MLTIKNFYRYLVVTLLYLVTTSAFAFNVNNQFILATFSVHGYLVAQEMVLNRIVDTYPDLAQQAYLAKSRFNSKFPNLKDKHIDAIHSMDIPEVDRVLEKSLSELQVNLSNQKLTKQNAIDFINEVNRRAKGEIESPILENVLMIQYDEHPEQEVLDGFYNKFSSQGAYKAKGIDITINTPKSWHEQEASRPNIVKKWISQNGTGINTIMLLVKDLPETDISINDIEMLYSTGGIYDMAPEGMVVVDKGASIVLDKQPGFWYRIGGEIQRLETKFYIEQIVYSVFYKDKFISLQCASTNGLANRSKVQLRLEKIKPLCATIANSLVIQDQWR